MTDREFINQVKRLTDEELLEKYPNINPNEDIDNQLKEKLRKKVKEQLIATQIVDIAKKYKKGEINTKQLEQISKHISEAIIEYEGKVVK
ncbi:hypothetical protein [Bacillus badius]|uniref:hypothetical protein n=1 Tax=Bacillus badius TaxID=1455 RepID=UPI0007B34E39|nr:hypothetical protein [Bacillus badius]KZR59366.1 hypothetical protein A3781_13270 [Bacillus badius]